MNWGSIHFNFPSVSNLILSSYRASDTLRKSQGSSSEHLSMSSRSPSVYETPPLPKDVDASSVYSMYEQQQKDVMTSSTESSHGLNTFSPPGNDSNSIAQDVFSNDVLKLCKVNQLYKIS